MATEVVATKGFLDAVAQQQAEATIVLKETILSNTEASKSITNTAEKLADMSEKQAQALNTDWPLLPSATPSARNTLHPASLVHTTLSPSQIKVQQHTLLAAKQLLIKLGPLDEESHNQTIYGQACASHKDLFNSWFDDDDKANDNFTVPSRAVHGVTIFDRPAIVMERVEYL